MKQLLPVELSALDYDLLLLVIWKFVNMENLFSFSIWFLFLLINYIIH